MTTTIFGYGSLMSIASTLRTMPNAHSFRPAVLDGYGRIFSLVSISGCRSGAANWETKEVGALAIRSCGSSSPSSTRGSSGSKVYGCVFDIPEGELASYLEREHRYKPIQVDAWVHETAVDGGVSLAAGSMKKVPCWTVVEQSDEEYAATMSAEEWQERVGQYYNTGPLWGRKDVLPMRDYLASCVHAAWELGGELWLKNLLDEATLADGNTSIRSYVRQHPGRFADLSPLVEHGK